MYKIKKSDDSYIPSASASAKLISAGPVLEVTAMAKPCCGPPVTRLNADFYVDERTGEVLEYKHITSRADSLDSIRHTLARIRGLINANVVRPECCRWVTLTYADNMTDSKQLYRDFVTFWKRFLRWCAKQGFPAPEYISVVEPQGRGAWHVHAFFIWGVPAPFIPNDTLYQLWRHGWTKIKALNDIDNIGAYFSAYLADIPVSDFDKLDDVTKGKVMENAGKHGIKELTDDISGESKKFLKGARLYLYPPKMNIVRHSKGIRNPTVEKMTYGEAKEKVSGATLTFSRDLDVVDDDGKIVNKISKEYYNMLR